MKKIVAILLVLTLLTGTACTVAEMMMGGWRVAEDNTLTDQRREVLDKALSGLLGVSYEPVAYLGSQVVAGSNHCYLCRATVVAPDAQPTLKLVYVYEDLQGNASIHHIADLDIAAMAQPQTAE